jgi:hypothetical protein
MSTTDPDSDDPLGRPEPDRRWRRAVRLLREGLHPGREDDRLVRLALAYLLWRERARKATPARPAPVRFAAMEEAWLLRHAGDHRRRWLVEAYVLAGLKPDAVGRLCGLSPAAAARYRDVFFDVTAWLPAPDALMALVFKGRREDQPSPDDEELFLKYYAVRGGPLAVDAVRHYYDCRDLLRVQPADLSPEQRRERVGLLRMHIALLARCLGSEASALKQIRELAALAGRLEGESAEPGVVPARGQDEEAVGAVIRVLAPEAVKLQVARGEDSAQGLRACARDRVAAPARRGRQDEVRHEDGARRHGAPGQLLGQLQILFLDRGGHVVSPPRSSSLARQAAEA